MLREVYLSKLNLAGYYLQQADIAATEAIRMDYLKLYHEEKTKVDMIRTILPYV